MKHHILLTLILLGLLNSMTMTFPAKTNAAIIGTRPPTKCILPKKSNAIYGTLAGTQVNYSIVIPPNWNGTLLLYSPMYISPMDSPPNPALVAPDSFTGNELLKEGFALASSSYGHGWAVEQAFQDQIALLNHFKALCGAPIHTIAWGQSLGGMVTAGLAQLYPNLFDGALPMCGVVAGSIGTWNQLLDEAFAFNVLAAGNILPLVHIPLKIALNTINQATSVLISAQKSPQGRARIALSAALGDIPGWYNATSPEPSRQNFAAQEQNQYLWESQLDFQFAFGARIEMEERAGGNPSWNTGIDYSKQLAQSADFQEVTALYKQAGLNLNQDLNTLAKAPRIKADPKAVDYLSKYFTFSGDLRIPILTMHTTGDGLAVNEDEQIYASQVNAKGKSGLLRQVFVHRANHCSFTPAEILAGVQTLIDRVKTGAWGESTDPAPMIKKATAFGSFLNSLPPAFLNFKPGPFLRPFKT
jgi:hypothetical protein